jgi:hypothetical protein
VEARGSGRGKNPESFGGQKVSETEQPIPKATRYRWLSKLALPPSVSDSELREAIADHRKAQGAGGAKEEKTRLECQKLQLQVEAAQVELDRVRGKLHDNDHCQAEWQRVANLIRTHFANLPANVLPDLLTLGLPQPAAPQVQQLLTDRISAILVVLSRAA